MPERKPTRKELLKSPDEFISLWRRIFNYVEEHPRRIVGMAAAVTAVLAMTLLGVYMYRFYQESLVSELNEVLAFAGSEEPMETRVEALQSYIEKRSASRRAALAAAKLGRLHYEVGDPERAVQALENALAWSGPDRKFKAAVRVALAHCWEAVGEIEKAIAVLLQAREKSNDFWEEQNTLQLARLYLAKEDYDQARSTYETFLKDYPNSPSIEWVEFKLRELNSAG